MSNPSTHAQAVAYEEGETDSLLPKEEKNKDIHPPMFENNTEKYILGIAYMLAMGVCGVVLVAIGSSLSDFADNCNTTSTDLGTVFIARGVGAIFGAISSAKLYLWYPGNNVLSISLTSIAILLFILPFNTSIFGIHILFLLLGLATAITDTGCQIMTRKIHGKVAGPWLGANTVAFGISGALVPLLEIITPSLYVQYSILTMIVVCVSFNMLFAPNPEKNGRLKVVPPKRPDGKSDSPHYHVEMVISLMVFCFIGGKVTMTAYLDTYVDDTNILSSSQGAYLILVLWIAITIGRLAGVQDQRFMTNKTLPPHLTILCIGGFLSMLLILSFQDSANALWVGIAFYGLFNGPCVGYCYDWNNRITYPTEKSMAIVMFGLNFGASLIPYATALIWNHGGGPITLMIMTFFSMFIPLPLLHTTKYLSYDPAVNPRIKRGYMDLPQDEEPI